MKIIKLLVFISIFSISTTNIAMEERPTQPCPYGAVARPEEYQRHVGQWNKEDMAKQKELERLNALEHKRAQEAHRMKPLKESAGNALIQSLLEQSDSQKTDVLNRIPLEVQKQLISFIDNKLEFLEVYEKNIIQRALKLEKLYTLKQFIEKHLQKTWIADL